MLGSVPRLILLAALLAGLVVAMPSAAAPVGSGQIAYATEVGGIYTVTADGSRLETAEDGRLEPVVVASLVPDGRSMLSRVRGDADKIQLQGDERGRRPTTRVVATGDIFLSRQPWSLDGSQIAWGPWGIFGDLYTASVEGGDVRRLTTDGLRKDPPVWSPTGSSLVYAAAFGDPERWELFVVGADGQGQRQITSGGQGMVRNVQPSWSPDGTSIAFLRQVNSESAIYVVRPDGTSSIVWSRPRPMATSGPNRPGHRTARASPTRTASTAASRDTAHLRVRRSSWSMPTARASAG